MQDKLIEAGIPLSKIGWESRREAQTGKHVALLGLWGLSALSREGVAGMSMGGCLAGSSAGRCFMTPLEHFSSLRHFMWAMEWADMPGSNAPNVSQTASNQCFWAAVCVRVQLVAMQRLGMVGSLSTFLPKDSCDGPKVVGS